MANVQLFAKQQNSNKYVALDLHVAEPIKLDLSVANIIQPTDTNSVYSKVFKVPHTSVNGPYFEGVFNVNSMNFDASIKADAYILDNGIFFENGNIRLNSIFVNSEDNSVEYEIAFYGSTSDFGSKIGGGFLNEVNLNKYNHDKNYTNIASSWFTPGLFNGDVVYGLIEWGYSYNDKNQPSVPTLSANFTPSAGSPPSAKGSFTNNLYPYKQTQWKPQIRAKALWDQIFEESGYTYDSTFLASDFFKKQYIISDNQARAILDNANTFAAEKQGNYYNVLAASFPWITPIEVADPGNNFTASPTTSGIYTAPSDGQYTFNMGTPALQIFPGNWVFDEFTIGWEARIIDVDTNNTVGFDVNQMTLDASNGYASPLQADFVINLVAGQRVKFEFKTYNITGDGYSGSTQIYFFSQYLNCTLAPNIMSFNAIMPSNIRKIDFMKSIINKYRLVFEPSKFQENHFTITPWKDWILLGRSKDWTDKLDTSKDMVIKPLFFDQARFQIYKDQEDSDYLNYNYQLAVKQTFGQLNLDSTNELIKGTKEYKDQFAPTPIEGIGWRAGTITEEQAAKFVIPHIAKDTGGNSDVVGDVAVGKREPIQPKLRLVFYNGVVSTPDNISWYAETDIGTYQTLSIYPLMSQYSEWPVTATTFDLNWENERPLWNVDFNGFARTPFSCFNTFWKTWYDVTFDPYSRLVEANFVLDYADVLDLKFNDYIFVKDAWYFVNSISGYTAGERSNCKVQLVKLGNNIGVTLPIVSPPVYTATPVCYHPSNICASYCCSQTQGALNTVIYIDGDTLITSGTAYNESTGGIFAAPGYYTNATGTVYMASSGVMSVQSPDCSCTPVYYTFNVYRNKSACDVCCNNGALITVYGANPVFEANNSLYTNTLLTTPALQGYYMTTTGVSALQVAANGVVVNTIPCTSCECATYYPFTTCYSAGSLCTACCCEGKGGTRTIWGADSVFSNNLTFYTSNAGTIAAPNGYYKFNSTNVAIITGGLGEVTSYGICSSCGPCEFPPIDFPIGVVINVTVDRPGYANSTLVQKSYDDGSSWVDVGSVTVGPSDIELSKSGIFAAEVGVLLRAINTSTVTNGTMDANYYIGLDQIVERSITTPNSITLTTSATTLGSNFEFNNIVTGGEIGTDDNLLVSGSFISYQGDTDHKGAIALTKTASVDTSIDFTSGFTNSGGLATCKSIIKIGSIIVVSGIFNEYKGSSLTSLGGRNNVVGLNLDGTFNTSFNANLVTGLGTLDGNFKLTYIDETKFVLWTLDNTPIDIDLVIIDNTGTFVIGVGDEFIPGVGFNSAIDAVSYYNNALYVIGNFGQYRSPTGVVTAQNKIIKLDLDLENDPSFNIGTGLVGNAYDIEATSTGVYICLGFGTGPYTYNGTAIPGNFFKLNFDGSLDTAFLSNIGTGAFPIIGVQADTDGIWLIGSFTSWNGVSGRYDIVRLNLDGTYNSDFINSTPFDAGRDLMNCKLSQDSLYVFGDFDTYKTVQSDGLIKLDKFTGAVDTTFAVGTGFATNPGFTNKVLDVFVYLTAIPPTTYLINTSYSEGSPCAAFCNTAYATPVYANATPLVNATILYADALGTTFPPAGFYATGNTIVEVDGNGVIIASINTGSCVCDNLYEFDASFDIDQCISCATTGTPTIETVYGANATWSRNRILYANSAGTVFALPGFYAYSGSIVLEVGDNGYVISAFDCAEVCPPLYDDCRQVSVINEAEQGIFVYFQRCEACVPDLYDSLYLPYGQETDLGSLVVYGSVSTGGGNSKIIYGAIC
ncbi:hypothetical protein UFOVP643_21 [uncultured Caudovirales phage]|uniref:Uncharacterized protein n=1 Tax=uncultured Caudovirales phage TaxID=2100421 RepID=A0A6J5NBZ2_9CAUD|nr:hypothetical protein UFOVP282_14 [uncultured Caudovirales phage]CAB4154685.1 hypothetical protein UFOVP643_21 [uncultured Caudovirales phage]